MSPEARWPQWPVIAVVALIVVVAAWLTMAFTFSLMSANSSVRAYAPLWIGNGVKAATASAHLERAKPTLFDLKEAQRLALIVIQREPANVVAVRSLGLIASVSSNDEKAKRLMTYSESLSRRDLPTQLWLLEKNVAANDIKGSLVHYDRALRTNIGARDILIPILSEAAKQPEVAVPLSKLLTKRPLWWTEFAEKFIYAADAPDSLALTMQALRLDPKKEGERNFLQQALVSLVQGGAPAKAYALFTTAVGKSTSTTSFVRDGGFSVLPVLAPFDWSLLDEPDLSAIRNRRADGTNDWSLFLTAQNGRRGAVARQLLMLPPGRFRLNAQGGDMPRDTASVPAVALVCASQSATSLGTFSFTAGAATASIDGIFSVPDKGCPAVWLLISRSAPLYQDDVTPWIDGLIVRRL